MKPSDVKQVFEELGAGVFEEKIAYALSDVCSAVVREDKVGEITIKLKVKRVGSTDQVNISHELGYKRPKKRGSIAETDSQETVMYVNEEGNITQFPENQTDMFLENAKRETV